MRLECLYFVVFVDHKHTHTRIICGYVNLFKTHHQTPNRQIVFAVVIIQNVSFLQFAKINVKIANCDKSTERIDRREMFDQITAS